MAYNINFRTTCSITITILILVFHAGVNSFADSTPSHTDTTENSSKTASLTRLLESIEYITREISETQEQLNTPEGKGKTLLLNTKIDELSRKLITLEGQFEYLASEVIYDSTQDAPQTEFNWNRELKALLGPLIRELQRLTLKPRQIEKLRGDIEQYDNRLEITHRALESINTLRSSPKCPANLRQRLTESSELWENRKKEIETVKRIAQLQLDKQVGGDTSLAESVQGIPGMFFKSHGRNASIAFFTFVLSALLMFKLHEQIRKYSPFHVKNRTFYGRMFDLSYMFLSALFCLSITLWVLYFFSDWVLLSLILIFIIGIVWASKETLPKIWHQARLILNFGPVREGELILYNGIPYKVISINIYTTLENPSLSSGRIRIPVADLLPVRSRPVSRDEPWFPSRRNDWVFLSDNTHGKVIAQTPDAVKIKLPGGSAITYPTQDYLALSPMNLSSGFRLWLTFGLDYRHCSEITTSIPELFRAQIATELAAGIKKEHVLDISTHFKNASHSSLDIEITADFSGDIGDKYMMLQRIIQKACVDTCNLNGLSIPFNQVTVHMSDGKH